MQKMRNVFSPLAGRELLVAKVEGTGAGGLVACFLLVQFKQRVERPKAKIRIYQRGRLADTECPQRDFQDNKWTGSKQDCRQDEDHSPPAPGGGTSFSRCA